MRGCWSTRWGPYGARRGRAAQDRLRAADAECLAFQDGSLDVVVSTFGVMFSPDQERAAFEPIRSEKAAAISSRWRVRVDRSTCRTPIIRPSHSGTRKRSRSAYDFSPSTVDKTTLVLRGSTSHPAVQRANALVSASLHRAELAMVEGAAHLVIAFAGTPRGRG